MGEHLLAGGLISSDACGSDKLLRSINRVWLRRQKQQFLHSHHSDTVSPQRWKKQAST